MAESPTAPENVTTESTSKYSAKGLRNLIDKTRARISNGEEHKDKTIRESILRSSNQSKDEEIANQAQRADEAEAKSMYDTKTGLHNDAWIQERIDNAIREAQRTGKNFFVEFMDIDDFKIVNSRFDHSGGDSVLRLFTNIPTRPNEDVARFGGDEFVQVLNDDIQEDEVVSVATRNVQTFVDKSRELITQIPIIDPQTPDLGEVTLSIGIIQYRPGMTFQDIEAESSQMLLKAKALGRDRIAMKNSAGEVKIFDRQGEKMPDLAEDPIPVS